jgi:hypothetical protein
MMRLSSIDQFLRGSLSRLVFRPWFDRTALNALGSWVFPASRLWASAEASGYDLDRFLAANPSLGALRLGPVGLVSTLNTVKGQRAEAIEAEDEWNGLFFGARSARESKLTAAEIRRKRTGRAFLTARLMFAALAHRANVSAVAWDLASEETVAQHLDGFLATPDALFRLPDPLPAVIESNRFRSRIGIEYALRLSAPVPGADTPSFARVFEPPRVPDPPTVIHCHGFGVEPEHLDRMTDEMLPLVSQGVRVVRVMAPWHGRRRRHGTWSGEPFLARVPLGPATLLSALVQEVGILVAWARATSAGQVAIGGISLGALTAQLAAVRMAAWSADHRPDAVFLAGTSDRLDRIAFESTLTRALGLDVALQRAGWTPEKLQHYAPLTNPEGEPALDPASIIMVLGAVDDVTPFDGGIKLAERWGIPAENQFHRDQGHFSLSLGLIPEDAPLRRLVELLRRD